MSAYEQRIASGDITPDPAQREVIAELSELATRLRGYQPSGRPVTRVASSMPKKAPKPRGFFSSLGGAAESLFQDNSARQKKLQQQQQEQIPTCSPAQRGLYVWGGCGCGKTFLMDFFFEHAQVAKKRRVHFHEFMIETHQRLHVLQKQSSAVKDKAQTVWTAGAADAQRRALQQGAAGGGGGASADDLVRRVAEDVFQDAWLLCFDEFQVTHISDAIIMKRLFSILLEKGAVVVATSNRPPTDLYLNGLNRQLFTPFIPLLQEFCKVHAVASDVDYRLVTTTEEDDRRVYITPLDEASGALLERKFDRMCNSGVNSNASIETKGRKLSVPRCGRLQKVGLFNFADLCDKPLGAEDYFAVATAFHTVFIKDIPQLTLQERDQVRRFITLIDCLYERQTKLVCTAAAPALELFTVQKSEEGSGFDEVFAWDRTASRLQEMQSFEYLAKWSREIDGGQYLALFEMSALDDDSVADLWMRYGNTDSGILAKDDLEEMLKEVFEVTQGHRHVAPELLDMCMAEMDPSQVGFIEKGDFEANMKRYGIVASWTQDRSEKLQRVVDMAFAEEGGVCSNMPFSLTIADPTLPDCPLIGCSTGFTELTGYALHEIVGQNCRFLLEGVPDDLLDSKTRDRVKAFIKTCLAHTDGPQAEGLFVQTNARKDGTLYDNLFFMRQVVLSNHPFILAVQVKVDSADQPGFTSMADPEMLEPEQVSITDVHRETIAQLEQHMAAVEAVLKELIPRLQGFSVGAPAPAASQVAASA